MSVSKQEQRVGMTDIGRDEISAYKQKRPRDPIPIRLAWAQTRGYSRGWEEDRRTQQQEEYGRLRNTALITDFENLPTVEKFLGEIDKIQFGLRSPYATPEILDVLAGEHLNRLNMPFLPVSVVEVEFENFHLNGFSTDQPWNQAITAEAHQIFFPYSSLSQNERDQLVRIADTINHLIQAKTVFVFGRPIRNSLTELAITGAAWIYQKQSHVPPISSPSLIPFLNILELGVIPYGPSRDGQSFEVLATPAPRPLSSA